MEEKRNSSADDCSFAGVKPIMVDLPYPPIKVQGTNPAHASLLSIDYCGAVSEMSAIAQYINNENRLAGVKCPIAKTLLGIAIAEMMHLQMTNVGTWRATSEEISAHVWRVMSDRFGE